MKILFLPNWKVHKCKIAPKDLQSPDYYTDSKNYWFFKYMHDVEVDIIDIRSFSFIENFEREHFRFYIIQTIKALPKILKYDLIISHGMQSGIVLAVVRKLFKLTRIPHIVFDIGSFNSARESGFSLKLMQFASKSINGIIYHTSYQMKYYEKCFPWLLHRSQFIPFGTDSEFFTPTNHHIINEQQPYLICVGYLKRDWKTVIEAFSRVHSNIKLKIVGNTSLKCNDPRIEFIPRIPIVKLTKLIQGAKFCILPLQWFNYSYGQMTLLQQMALGKTVIVANVPSIVDYVTDKQTALLYKPEDSTDLQNKIEWCLNNEFKIKIIGEQAARSVHDNYNEIKMAKKIELFLNKYL